jgi:hypothetical protein
LENVITGVNQSDTNVQIGDHRREEMGSTVFEEVNI